MFKDTFLFMCHAFTYTLYKQSRILRSLFLSNTQQTSYTHMTLFIFIEKSIFASIKDKQYRKQQEKRVKKVKNCVSRLVCRHREELLVAIINNVEQCLRKKHTQKSIYLNLDTKSKQEESKKKQHVRCKKITVLTTKIKINRILMRCLHVITRKRLTDVMFFGSRVY